MHFSSIFQIRAVWRVFAAAFPALAPSPTSPNAAFSAQVQIPPFGAPRRNRRGAARAPHCASRNAAKAAAFAAAFRCSRRSREQRAGAASPPLPPHCASRNAARVPRPADFAEVRRMGGICTCAENAAFGEATEKSGKEKAAVRYIAFSGGR